MKILVALTFTLLAASASAAAPPAAECRLVQFKQACQAAAQTAQQLNARMPMPVDEDITMTQVKALGRQLEISVKLSPHYNRLPQAPAEAVARFKKNMQTSMMDSFCSSPSIATFIGIGGRVAIRLMLASNATFVVLEMDSCGSDNLT